VKPWRNRPVHHRSGPCHARAHSPRTLRGLIDRGHCHGGRQPLLRGLDKLISEETGLPVACRRKSAYCRCDGDGPDLEELHYLKRVTVSGQPHDRTKARTALKCETEVLRRYRNFSSFLTGASSFPGRFAAVLALSFLKSPITAVAQSTRTVSDFFIFSAWPGGHPGIYSKTLLHAGRCSAFRDAGDRV